MTGITHIPACRRKSFHINYTRQESKDPRETLEKRAFSETALHNPVQFPPIDADLQRLIDAWPTLPEALRAGILAMIDAVRK